MSIINARSLFFLYLSLILVSCSPQRLVLQEDQNGIITTGQHVIKVLPDTVQFIVVIEAKQKELEPAKQKVEDVTKDVSSVLKKYEIDESEIEYNIPQIDTDATSSKVYGYIVNQEIFVNFSELSKLASLLSDILEAGAYDIRDIKFSVSDLEKYKRQALEGATEDAKQRALVMSKQLGLDIGDPISVKDTISNYNPEYSYTDYKNFNENTSSRFREISINATVSVTFEIK